MELFFYQKNMIYMIVMIIWLFYIPLLIVFKETHDQEKLLREYILLMNMNTTYFVHGILIHYFQNNFLFDFLTIFPFIVEISLEKVLELSNYQYFGVIHFPLFLFFLKIREIPKILNFEQNIWKVSDKEKV